MLSANELRKQVQELTAALARAEAAEKAEKEREADRKRKAEAKRRAEEEEKVAAETAARANRRKKSRSILVVPDSEEDESEEYEDPDKGMGRSCSACIKRGCKCIMVQVSHFISDKFLHTDNDELEGQSQILYILPGNEIEVSLCRS